MSAYEDLRKRIADYLTGQFIMDDISRVPADECLREADYILAEVYRTLENVTPEMDDAWDLPGRKIDETCIANTFLAMLRASPLAPPKEGT